MERQKKLDKKLLDSASSSYATFADVFKLVNNGADLNARDEQSGETVVHRIFFWRSSMDAKVREILSLCRERGIDMNVCDNSGHTPLHRAAENLYASQGEGIRMLLDYGADIEARAHDGRTPLHSAAAGHGLVTDLLELGANPNALDNEGLSPLHYAARRGLLEAASELLLKGADPRLQSAGGKTPADIASDNAHFTLAALLRKKAREAEEAGWKPQRAEGPQDPWKLIDKTSISRINDAAPAGYRITEIFNFSARLYTQISTNLETKAEALAIKTFDEFADKTQLKLAFAQLERLHGEADPASVSGNGFDKTVRLQYPPGL